MFRQLLPGLRIKLVLTLVFGIAYPLAMMGISQLLFPHQANGSLVTVDGKIIGSELIGQSFTRPEYFHPRPSSAGSGYDPIASGGSNLGATSAKLILGTTKLDDKKNTVVDFDGVSLRVAHYVIENGIPYESSKPLDLFKTPSGDLDDVKLIQAFNDPKDPLHIRALSPIPADAVTGSGSGLDPHISPSNAQAQTARVAKARGAAPGVIRQLVAQATETPTFGLLGEPRVNVLQLNLALDRQFPRH